MSDRAAHTDDKRAHSAFGNSENADRAALVEKVARAMCADWYDGNEEVFDLKNNNFRSAYEFMAAIAITLIRAEVLEEAARELDRWGDIYGDNAARAIRALKDKP
jgi:hypothetical protein